MSSFNYSLIDDDWWNVCRADDIPFFTALAETFRRTIHYDTVSTVLCIILLVLPMLFKIYGFGVQTQLRAFYNRLYSNFNSYQIIFGLGAELISLFHIFINQQPACIKWDKTSFSFSVSNPRVPNLDLFIVCILAEALIIYRMKMLPMRILVGLLIIIMCSVSMMLIGAFSISGAITTISFSFWVI